MERHYLPIPQQGIISPLTSFVNRHGFIDHVPADETRYYLPTIALSMLKDMAGSVSSKPMFFNMSSLAWLSRQWLTFNLPCCCRRHQTWWLYASPGLNESVLIYLLPYQWTHICNTLVICYLRAVIVSTTGDTISNMLGYVDMYRWSTVITATLAWNYTIK